MSTLLVRRVRITVRGVVQGVGFRPFVFGLAESLGLHGFVGNDASGVFIELEGPPPALEVFVQRLTADAPPLAAVDDVTVAEVAPAGEAGFRIVESRIGAGATTLVPPDVAMCTDCRREVLDPADRRFRYPFTTCTNCGPRFTIITALPYDRPATTMAGFPLCAACESEYHDPHDRRFHAQPVACPECGPRLAFAPSEATSQPTVAGTDAALAAAQAVLAAGGVVAVKGIGGYHLACDATSAGAVGRLRELKARYRKPFAVMAPDLATVVAFAEVSPAEARLLGAPEAPIVLLRARPSHSVGALAAPGNGRVGVLLAYTPLHLLLFQPAPGGPPAVPQVLVMTSGNRADEPIVTDDEDARTRLGDLCDGFLTHDRPINVPCDDSVVRVHDGRELPVRRSRGYAPLPVRLPFEVAPTLAVGGEIKTTFCLADGRHAWLSQHLGDMGNLETLRAFERSVTQLCDLYRVAPTVVAADAHPGYLTSRWADGEGRRLGWPVVRVQHHHAHAAALMAENGLADGDALLTFTFDGTGFGTDGTIWGGEVLLARYDRFERRAHLATFPLPGGDAAIRHPGRVALALLHAAGVAWDDRLACVAAADDVARRVLARQLVTGAGCTPTSSMGRLFDGIAALVGVCQEATYEAQAAIELEARVDPDADGGYTFGVDEGGGVVHLDPAPVVRAVVSDVMAGVDTARIATRFHRAVAGVVVEVARRLQPGGGPIGLTGGVFQNVTLLGFAEAGLRACGFEPLDHRRVPPNDGGLALGQAVIAGRRARPDTRGD